MSLFGAGVDDMDLLPDRARRRLHVLDIGLGIRIVGLTSRPITRGSGHELAQQLQSLCRQARLVKKLTPVTLPPGRLRLATRPSLTGSPPLVKTIGIVAVAALAAKADGTPLATDHGHLAADQLGRQRRQPIVLTFRPAIFDRDILALDITGFAQTLAERGNEVARLRPRTRREKPDRPASPAAARAPRAATPPRRRAA